MKIVILLILISVSIALVFLAIFYWSMKSGQYDDTYTPSVRMLFEDKQGEGEVTRPEEQQKLKP
jgi:cbb3-type cytochrome oxidase maturation protein